jgi:hypothetical protein
MDCGFYLSPFSSNWPRKYLHACTRNAKLPPRHHHRPLSYFSVTDVTRRLTRLSYQKCIEKLRMVVLLCTEPAPNASWEGITYCECEFDMLLATSCRTRGSVSLLIHCPLVCGFFAHIPSAGRAIAQAARVRSCGICGGQSGAGQVFSEYFCFPCQSSDHQILHHHNHPGQVQ